MLKIELKNLTAKRIPPIRLLKKATGKALKSLGITGGELGIVFVTDSGIKRLNRKYKKKNEATDVLAFDTVPLGDIAVSVDRAEKNARRFKTSRDKEICLYIIHGILHLVGYRDGTPKERRRMEKKQNKIFKDVWSSIA